MYQGETITTTIKGFPIPVSSIRDLRILFSNNGRVLLEKTLADCTVSDETVSFELTQQESLSLCTGKIFRSVIIITQDGKRMESRPSPFTCNMTLKSEVL